MLWTFVPDLPVLAAYLVASVVLGLTPGPDMTFFLSKTVAQSRKAGFAALGGVSVGLVIHSVLVAAGLSVVLAASATAFTALKVVGAAYLAYLAFDAIRHGSSLTLAKDGRPEPLRAVAVKGLLINLLNPKVIIFFVTFLPQFVSAHDPTRPARCSFSGSLSWSSTFRSARRSSSPPTASRSCCGVPRAPAVSSTGSLRACLAHSR
jgi:threonine/homoserine/homoserine lactone efflux protein